MISSAIFKVSIQSYVKIVYKHELLRAFPDRKPADATAGLNPIAAGHTILKLPRNARIATGRTSGTIYELHSFRSGTAYRCAMLGT